MLTPGWRNGCALVFGSFILLMSGCSSSNNASTPAAGGELVTAVASSAPTVRATPSRPVGSPSAGIPGLFGSPAAGTPTAAAAPPLSQQQLAQAALQVTDLPSGFVLTSSGPGGPELGRDVVASYQGEFQQRDVTSPQSLQQTIVIVDLLGSYRDPGSALSAIKAVNVQNLNQLLGGVNLTAEPATVPAIEEDASGFHFSGDTNGASVGGYMVVFHRGSTAVLVVTAAVKGSESLPQTIDLAQKQAQKIRAAG